ncbi:MULTISPECIES: RNA polymerase sigma factor [unclassified Streptosporangium]|uniref:RNA polymerase sigma factor n=1 Tax=Streptosporangium sp. NPDC005286 TaxID=3154463 RepID=UPI0033A842E2
MSTPDVIPEEWDEALLRPRSLDDPGYFDDLFRRHAPPIHRYAARRLGSHLADDIVAATFHQALKHRHSYDPARGDTLSWLWTIATNLIRRHHRSEARLYRALARTGVDPVIEGHADRVVDQVTAATVTPHLAKALAGLRKVDRDLLLLVAWGELTYQQVADVLDVPVGTVRSRLNRTRAKLRKALGEVSNG